MPGLTDLERRTIRSALVAELGRTEEQAASLARQFDDIVAAAEMSNIEDLAFERGRGAHVDVVRLLADTQDLPVFLSDLADG